ncbi:MAG: hypothetical protein NTZ74_13560 [Chloroflexi bacterium]|nr:hypothetical protein [Chloroflexota bacterium]
MKIGLWAFTFASLGEYVLRPVLKEQGLSFFDSRLLSGVLVPWTMFFWYILPVLFGKPLDSKAI